MQVVALQAHMPPWQMAPALHAVPHAPQDEGLLVRFTHPMVGQYVWPAFAQVHFPPAHIVPPAHTVPQDPQFLASVLRFAHAPLHKVSP
jgi:hypothetical protein